MPGQLTSPTDSRLPNVIKDGVTYSGADYYNQFVRPLEQANYGSAVDDLQTQLQQLQQQYAIASQPIYNRNTLAGANASLAGSRYGIGQDLASLNLQAQRAQSDVLNRSRQLANSEMQSPFTAAKRLFGY